MSGDTLNGYQMALLHGYKYRFLDSDLECKQGYDYAREIMKILRDFYFKMKQLEVQGK